MRLETTREKVWGGLVGIGIGLTLAARLITVFYFWNAMPRTPEPSTGHIYPAGAAYNTLVYVTRKERAWSDFITYDTGTIVGVGMVLFVILILLPGARRQGEL